MSGYRSLLALNDTPSNPSSSCYLQNSTIYPPPSRVGLSSIYTRIHSAITNHSPNSPHFSSWHFYTLWQIWKTRNEVAFENKTLDPIETLRRTKSLFLEYIGAISTTTIKYLLFRFYIRNIVRHSDLCNVLGYNSQFMHEII